MRWKRAVSVAAAIATALISADPAGARTPSPPDAAGPATGVAPDAPSVSGSGIDWCAHTMAGPAGAHAPAIDWSAAHNLVRDFAVSSRFSRGDSALLAAVGGADPFGARLGSALGAYDRALEDVCVLPASNATLGAATVTKVGKTAIVTPGTGAVRLPAQTNLVVIDLRNVPSVAGVQEAVMRAVSASTSVDFAAPKRSVRTHDGPVDEAFSPFNVYGTGLGVMAGAPGNGSSPVDRPIVFLTGSRTAPDAAAIAGELRLQQRAWILGENLYAESAESRWTGVGSYGVAARVAAFQQQGDVDSESLPGQTIDQDDPNDPSTASFRLPVTVDSVDSIDSLAVTVDGATGDDLDLFVLRDGNGDATFSYPGEVVALSAGPTGDEHAEITTPSAGDYEIWVHGYSVPGGTSTFDLTIDRTVGGLWPDVIPRDAAFAGSSSAEIAAAAAAVAATPPAPVDGPALRTRPDAVIPFGATFAPAVSKASLRAALLIMHGMARRWFPYFDVVGDGIDDRLLEQLAAADQFAGGSRTAGAGILGHFVEVLHDGHGFLFDTGPSSVAGYLPVAFDEIGDEPVVRRSLVPQLSPGDVVIAVDGEPIADYLAAHEAVKSAATEQYLVHKVFRDDLVDMFGPTTYTVRGADGTVRSETIDPQPIEMLIEAQNAPYPRPSGSLADLGAANLSYINMSGGVSTTESLLDAIAAARGSDGLVVDMRDYPTGIDHYDVFAHLIRKPALTARFGVEHFLGPDVSSFTSVSGTIPPAPSGAYTGPIVLLTTGGAVSAAENFMQMLVGSGRVSHVVGRPSAGTNGNITAVPLPGGYVFTYTGMQILNPDGSQFHGIGIQPDIPVAVTQSDLAAGIDRDILTAIATLQGG